MANRRTHSTAPPFVIIWHFQVRPGREAEFEKAYGEDGEWVKLFRRGRGFLRTELYHESRKRRRYLTIDYWDSQESYATFRRQAVDEFEALDKRCEALTVSEIYLGSFVSDTRVRLREIAG